MERTPDWLHLGDGERVVWHARPHPIAIGWRLPVGFGLIIGGLLVLALLATNSNPLVVATGLVFTVAGVGVLFIGFVFWTNTRYVLTSSQLYLKRGVFSRDVTQFRLDRIQNTTLDQGVIGRLLGYGQLTVYTAGSAEPELTFDRVPNPGSAASKLSQQLEGGSEPAI